MAKKPTPSKSDRSDPKKNKSLAIRLVLEKQPAAKTAEIIAAVKKEYGHTVNADRVYMVKTKSNMAADGRAKKSDGKNYKTPMTSALRCGSTPSRRPGSC